MDRRETWIGPSILTADWLNLGSQIAEAEAAGVDFFHLDIMDGRFVPNISFGFPVLEAVRSATRLPLDVHLMIQEPDLYIQRFVESGADIVTVHVETCPHLHGTLQAITSAGAIAGVTLNPATPLAAIEEVIPLVGQVLIMSVNPGFGGQSFIPTALDRIRRVREMIDRRNPACRLEVDGGIKDGISRRIVEAGADMLVVGSAIFGPDRVVETEVKRIRDAIA